MSRPMCFGGLSCKVEDHECPYTEECKQALFDELAGVPLSVFDAVYELRMMEYCRARVKTFAWECRVKEAKK